MRQGYKSAVLKPLGRGPAPGGGLFCTERPLQSVGRFILKNTSIGGSQVAVRQLAWPTTIKLQKRKKVCTDQLSLQANTINTSEKTLLESFFEIVLKVMARHPEKHYYESENIIFCQL